MADARPRTLRAGIWQGVLAKRALEEASESDSGTRPALKREFGMLDLTLIGISNAIGAGIFVLTGVAAAKYAGPGISLSYALAAVTCLFTALCYGELSVLIPSAGGSYAYATVSLGRLPAWLIGWCMILEYLVAGATVAVGWSGYAVALLEQIGLHLSPRMVSSLFESSGATRGGVNVPAMVIVLLCTFVLLRGIKGSIRFNAAMVGLKLAVILLVIGVGVFHIDPDNWRPFIPENEGSFGRFGVSGVFTGAAVAFFSYTGFEAMSTCAREARRPERDLPRALLTALICCAALYIGMSLVMTGLAPYRMLDTSSPVSAALRYANGRLEWVETLVNVGTVLGLGSAVLVSLYGQSRTSFAMARNGQMPSLFAAVHHRHQTPAVGTLLIGLLAAIIAGFFPIALLGELVSMGCLIAFGSVCVGVIVLRHTYPDAPRPFKVPFYPAVPIAGLVSCLVLMFSLPAATWRYLGLWLIGGLLIYLLVKFGRNHWGRGS